MALVIGVRKGSKLMIGQDMLEVLDTHGMTANIRMHYDDGPMDAVVSDQLRHTFRHCVYISTAKNKSFSGPVRLVFEAPSSVSIKRMEDHALAAD